MSDRPWELDDEEAERIAGDMLHYWEDMETEVYRAIATAAQKRLVEWLVDENMNKDADWEASRTDVRLKYAEVQMDKGDLWIDFVSYATVRAALEVE